jgi:hypothetical protein
LEYKMNLGLLTGFLLVLSIGVGAKDEWGFTQTTISVPLDHFNPQDLRTFKLRYWYNNEAFNAKDLNSPIFLYICGESICKVPDSKGRGFPSMVAKQNKGLILILEHRYYGYS